MKRIILIFSCLLAFTLARAEGLRLPHFMGSDMVLQQNTDANIWGWADAGAKVKVSVGWSKARYTATAGEDGFWKVAVATPAASFTPYTVTISSGKEKINLDNVLIGEVWVCSGQSNMEMPMGGWNFQPIENGAEAMRESNHFSHVRMIYLERTASTETKEDCNGTWKCAGSENIAQFSATAYFFGKRLAQELDIPIGLIVTCWGGTQIECWMDRDALKSVGETDETIAASLAPHEGSWAGNQYTVLYNAMIWPLRHYTVNGFIWYQGCSNVGKVFVQDYAQYQAAMVTLWRRLFGRGDIPFYYVQIAPHPYSSTGDSGLAPLLRERQRVAATLVPNSAMATTMDLVYEFENGIIHPRMKAQVGDRLAYLALENWYGFKNYGSAAPQFISWSKEGDGARIAFSNVTGGLHSDAGWQFNGVEGFEVAGENGEWHPAAITNCEGNTIVIKCEDVSDIKNIRYLWHDFSLARIWNNHRLPVLPFNTSL